MAEHSNDSYYTIASAFRSPELKVQGSRFIADLFPVTTKEEIESALGQIRKEFYDATHHCYAYRLGIQGDNTRAADDGEPAGTAGKPILMVLQGAELTNILCIVTRYFGGTKLGTGGLARAYSDTAKEAVAKAPRKEIVLTEPIELTTSYELHPALERMIRSYNIEDLTATFDDRVTIRIDVRRSALDRFTNDIRETFYGNVLIAEPKTGSSSR